MYRVYRISWGFIGLYRLYKGLYKVYKSVIGDEGEYYRDMRHHLSLLTSVGYYSI